MRGENIQVSMPTFWPISNTQNVYKAAEASSGLPETEWLSSDHIPRRHTDDASEQGSVRTNDPTDLPTVREPSEQEEVHTDSFSGDRFSGLSCMHPTTMRLLIPPPPPPPRNSEKSNRMLHQASVSVREIARFVGKTTATIRAIPLAPLHYRALQMQMNSVLPLNYTQEEILDKYNTILSLNLASRENLEWWVALTTAPVGAPVCPPDPSITVHSDTSNQGWGAVLNGHSHTGGCGLPRKQLTT